MAFKTLIECIVGGKNHVIPEKPRMPEQLPDDASWDLDVSLQLTTMTIMDRIRRGGLQ